MCSQPDFLAGIMDVADWPGLRAADIRRLRRRGVRSTSDVRTAMIPTLGVPRLTQAFLRWRPQRSISRSVAAAMGVAIAGAIRVVDSRGNSARPQRVDVVGSVRRGESRTKDVDLLVTVPRLTTRRTTQISLASRSVRILETYASGGRRVSAIVEYTGGSRPVRAHVDFFLAAPGERPYALLHHTGPWRYNVRLRALAKARGLTLNQYGLWAGRRNVGAGIRTEGGVARLLGVRPRPPFQRV